MDNSDLIKLQVHENISVKNALKQMDQTARKILFVVNDEKKLLGVATDGDFRTWILAGKSMEKDISGVFNRNPIKFREDYDIKEIKHVLAEKRIEAVPIVDNNQRIVDVLFWEDLLDGNYKKTSKKLDVSVAIMAGGEGTRLSPYTKVVPKPLITFGEKPIVEVIMDNFSDFGCNDFYLLLGYKGAMIQAYFNTTDSDYRPNYKFENEPGGTSGALKMLKSEKLSDSFFVSNCDIVVKADYADIYDFHKNNDYDITVVSAMRHFVVPYGVMEMTTTGSMKNIMEKPEYDFLVNTGMYVLKKDLISLVPEDGMFHFTDLIKKTQEKGGKIGIYPVSEKSWFDIGQIESLEASTALFMKKWMKEKKND